MSLKRTFIFALIVAAFVLYIFRVELPEEQAKLTEQNLFAGVRKEAVVSIEIQGKKGEFTLVNHNPATIDQNRSASEPEQVAPDALKSWELAGIVGSDLDESGLNSVLTALIGFKTENQIDQADLNPDLSVYGLKNPELTVKTKIGDKLTEIKFGNKNTYVNKRYVMISDRPGLFLVADSLFSAADRSAKDFRNKTPLKFLDSDLRAVTVSSTDPQIKFEANADRKWQLTAPLNAPASGEAVATLLREIRNLSATEFVDRADLKLEDYGLKAPELKVLLEFTEKSAAAREVSFGRKGEISYFSVSGKPSIFQLAKSPVANIKKPVNSYREKKLFTFAIDQVISTEIEHQGDPKVVLSKTDNKWTVGDKLGDEVFIRDYLKNLSNLEAVEFVDTKGSYGLEQPWLKISVTLVSGETVDTKVIQLGNETKDGTGRYAANDAQPGIVSVSKDAAIKLVPRLDSLTKVVATPNVTPTG